MLPQSSLLQRRPSFSTPLQLSTKTVPWDLPKEVDDPSKHPICPKQAEGQTAGVGIRDKWLGAYSSLEKLAEGTSAVVYRAERLSDKQCVALKLVRSDDEEMLKNAHQEFDILKSLQHPCIVKALDFISTPLGTALVMDYFAGCNLKTAVRDAPSRHFKEPTARAIFLKLADAVEHMHSRQVIHRDIKAENVLVSSEADDIRLIDFNVAANENDGLLTLTGTVAYMPPEVLLGGSPSAAGDIWALGLCLHFMLCGKLPLDRQYFASRWAFAQELVSVGLAGKLESTISQDISRECKDALQCCLQADPGTRATGHELLAGNSTPWTPTENLSLMSKSAGA